MLMLLTSELSSGEVYPNRSDQTSPPNQPLTSLQETCITELLSQLVKQLGPTQLVHKNIFNSTLFKYLSRVFNVFKKNIFLQLCVV